MADLRNLTIGIDHRIDSSPILTADKRVDSYKQSIVGTDKNMTQLGTNTTKVGRNMVNVGRTSERAAQRGNAAFSGFNSTMARIGAAIGTYFTFRAVKDGLQTTIGLASSLEEETAKFETVFKELADPAAQWAEDYADSVGRSIVDTKSALASSQSLFVGFGATREQAFEFAKSIQQVGTDLASMNNLADTDVLNSMRSALVGNHEAARAFDVVLTEANLQLRAQRLGLRGNFRDLDPLTKSQVRFAEIVSQSTDAIGDAERTQGSYTNQLKRFRGSIKDIVSEEGLNLLGFFTDLLVSINDNRESIRGLIKGGIDIAGKALDGLGKTIEFVRDNADFFIPVLSGLATAFAALSILKGINFLVLTFNALLTANPIGVIVLGLAGAVAIGVAIYRNWDKIKQLYLTIFNIIKEKVTPIFKTMSNVAKTSIEAIGGFFRRIGQKIADNPVFKFISNIAGKSLDFFKGIGDFFRGGGTDSPTPAPDVPGFQRGTMAAPQGLARVHDGELINFGGGERVYTAATTRRIMNNRTSISPKINIYINGGDGKGAKDIANEIRDQIDRYFRNMATREGLTISV